MSKKDWFVLTCMLLIFVASYFALRPSIPPKHSIVEFTEDDVYNLRIHNPINIGGNENFITYVNNGRSMLLKEPIFRLATCAEIVKEMNKKAESVTVLASQILKGDCK